VQLEALSQLNKSSDIIVNRARERNQRNLDRKQKSDVLKKNEWMKEREVP
jgi:hypothetical protein